MFSKKNIEKNLNSIEVEFVQFKFEMMYNVFESKLFFKTTYLKF